MTKTYALAAALLGATVLATPAQAQFVDNVVVFGDSLSDPGNIPLLFGGIDFPPSPPFFGNRFSNGLVFSELLPGLLGTEFDMSLNFAVGGATTGFGNVDPNIPPDIPTGVLGQLGSFAASGFNGGGANDLGILFAGNNDFFGALGGPLPPTAAEQEALLGAVVFEGVANLTFAAETLAASGIEQIAVFNLSDLGIIPLTLSDPFVSAAATAGTIAFNDTLEAAVGGLADDGLNVTVVDTFTLFNEVLANPAEFGITDTTTPCILTDCIALPTAEQNAFLFFDSVHPTANIQAELANAVADTIIAPLTTPATGEFAARYGEELNRQILRLGRLSADQDGGKLRPFFDVTFLDGSRESEPFTVGSDFDALSFVLGTTVRFTDQLFGGVFINYGTGDSVLAGGLGSFETRSLSAGGLIGAEIGRFSATFTAGFTGTDFDDIIRNTGFVDRQTFANTSGDTVFRSAEARWTQPVFGDTLVVTPIARVISLDLDIDAFTETGAPGLDQFVSDRSFATVLAEAGAELGGRFTVLEGLDWRVAGLFSGRPQSDSQTIETNLVTVEEVVRTLVSDPTDGSFARIEGGVGFNLPGQVRFEVGGAANFADEDTDFWSISARFSTVAF
ncbi:MAG: autotransporter domain-containing protein [Maricaulaceae bacterium]